MVASGTARGWGCTGQGLSILHETPTFVEYTNLSASSTQTSCSTRGCENDRLTATARTGDGPVGCQIDDGNNVAQTGRPIHGAYGDGCQEGAIVTISVHTADMSAAEISEATREPHDSKGCPPVTSAMESAMSAARTLSYSRATDE